jgi:hypothetical protein
MQRAPLNDMPLEGSTSKWSRPWYLWFDSLKNLASSFLGLTDTPDSYTGQSGKVVAVKTDESGLEFISSGGITNSHNGLDGIQGGSSSERYHLSQATSARAGAFLNGGSVSHTGVDSHIADAAIHFTESSINHNSISNRGTNSHTVIDSHLSSTSNPHNTTFLKLTDTPSSYTGQSGKVPVVNAGENGLEFQTVSGGGGGGSAYFPSGW